MSILPSQAQGSTSSSLLRSPSPNPNPNHGHNPPSPPSSSFLPGLSDVDSPPTIARSGSLASAAEDHGSSSRKMTELEMVSDNMDVQSQNGDMNSQYDTREGGVGSPRSNGKMSGRITTPQKQEGNEPMSSRGGNTHSSGRRAQMVNANHLLNFQYDSIARPLSRPPPQPRRSQRIKPYNKDLFLQANYKFVVFNSGKYTPESMNPDKMLQWEDIICVRYSTPFAVQCPICLEYPLCPQITSCGHIFCFPCILRYLLMGVEDHKGDSFKRCPLCFDMLSQKDLYTVYIENVKQLCVGDTVQFMLLTREKGSFMPSKKNKDVAYALSSCNDDIYDPFSKFTFTRDAEISVRKAISDLDDWLVKADSGLVDDLEKLPYVCAAMEQLEQRKKHWNEQQTCDTDSTAKCTNNQRGSQGNFSVANITIADLESCSSGSEKTPIGQDTDNAVFNVVDPLEGQEAILSAFCNDSNSLQGPLNCVVDVKEKATYNFYQAVDGQHVILHPLNMKCLLHHYGSYGSLPHRISGTILQLETVTQSEAMRRRYRYLSHFSLTTSFQLCEIDLNDILPAEALLPFMDEIKKREKQRKQLANKERKEKIRAEAAASHFTPISPSFRGSFHDNSPNFSMDDFEALGSSPPSSSSPPGAGSKILFSNVARLGFAAGHDSPALKIEESSGLHDNKVTNDSSTLPGLRNSGTPSFANIMTRAKSAENLEAPKTSGTGKKAKKPSKVLLSTAGGRRY